MNITELNLKRIRRILATNRNVMLAFVFGSFARGKNRAGSDLDIAILLNKIPQAKKRLDTRLGLSGKIEELVGHEVDIVLLNTAGSILKFQVVRDGKQIFERRKGAALKFRFAAIKEYFDYLPTFNFHYNRLKGGKGKHGQCRVS